MSPDKAFLHPLNQSLDAFEDAIKKHEHRKFMGESEVSLRQEVDRTRQAVVDLVATLLEKRAAPR